MTEWSWSYSHTTQTPSPECTFSHGAHTYLQPHTTLHPIAICCRSIHCLKRLSGTPWGVFYIKHTKIRQSFCYHLWPNRNSKREGYVCWDEGLLGWNKIQLYDFNKTEILIQVLTPEEFVRAGDFLVKSCPTWSWCVWYWPVWRECELSWLWNIWREILWYHRESGDPSRRWSFLPAGKQYLTTKNGMLSCMAQVVCFVLVDQLFGWMDRFLVVLLMLVFM